MADIQATSTSKKRLEPFQTEESKLQTELHDKVNAMNMKRKHNEVLDDEHLIKENKEFKMNTREEIQQRVIYKAKRFVQEDQQKPEEQKVNTETNSTSNESTHGIFKLNSGLSLSTSAKISVPQVSFKFNFQNPFQKKDQNQQQQEPAEETEQPQNIHNPFSKQNSLADEKRFIVNKDLFSNPFINPFKINFSANKQSESNHSSNPLVQNNPLSSTESIGQQKQLSLGSKKSSPVKSLFDIEANQKYKKPDLQFKPPVNEKNEQENVKPSFKFNTENLFGQKKEEGERGLVVKPVFTTSNPFKIPGSQSSLFTSGKSLFETSQLQTTFNLPRSPSKTEESNEDEEDKLQEDVKEKVEQNSLFQKKYQKQIFKLKTLKGVGTAEKKPSRKDNGYISIELSKEKPVNFIVYRNYLGATQFSGVISSISKIKEIESPKAGRYKVKVSVGVKENGIYQVEHCEITFINDKDRKDFIDIFKQSINNKTNESEAPTDTSNKQQ